MRKLVWATTAGVVLAGSSMLVGCNEEAGVKTETQVKGPGGTATRTDQTTVKQSGQNPPSIPGDTKTPNP